MRIPALLLALLLSAVLALPREGEGKSDRATLPARADSLFRSRKYAEATEVYKRSGAAAAREKNRQIQVQAYARAARGYLISERKEEGRPWLARARRLATPAEPLGWSGTASRAGTARARSRCRGR